MKYNILRFSAVTSPDNIITILEANPDQTHTKRTSNPHRTHVIRALNLGFLRVYSALKSLLPAFWCLKELDLLLW